MGEGTEGCSRQLEERNLQQLKNILELEQCGHPQAPVPIPLCFLTFRCLSTFLSIELQISRHLLQSRASTGVWAWGLGPGAGVRLQGQPLPTVRVGVRRLGFTAHFTGLRLI